MIDPFAKAGRRNTADVQHFTAKAAKVPGLAFVGNERGLCQKVPLHYVHGLAKLSG
jgi:hypothetical protein